MEHLFESVIPEFVQTARKLYGSNSLFPLLEDLTLTEGVTTDSTLMSTNDNFSSLSKVHNGITYSCTARRASTACGWAPPELGCRLDASFSRTSSIIDILPFSDATVKVIQLETGGFRLAVDLAEKYVTNDVQISSIIGIIVKDLFDSATWTVSSIDRIEFPYFQIEGFFFDVLRSPQDTVFTINMYSTWTECICGQWKDIRMAKTQQSSAESANSHIKGNVYNQHLLYLSPGASNDISSSRSAKIPNDRFPTIPDCSAKTFPKNCSAKTSTKNVRFSDQHKQADNIPDVQIAKSNGNRILVNKRLSLLRKKSTRKTKPIQTEKEANVKDAVEWCPSSSSERKICTIVTDVLNSMDIKPTSHCETWLHMGLDSIQMAELEFAIQEKITSFQIPFGTVAKNPSIQKLVKFLVNSNSLEAENARTDDTFQVKERATLDLYNNPLSSHQQRILFECRMKKEQTAQFLEIAKVHIDNVDLKKVERVVRRQVMRHKALRTIYPNQTQIILSGTEALIVIETGNMHSKMKNPLTLSIDIELEPPMKIRYSNDEDVLIIAVHHIAVDGWSFGVFHKEGLEMYAKDKLLDKIPRTSDYVNFALAESQEQPSADALHYWEQQLTGLELTELPSDCEVIKPNSSQQCFRSLPPELSLNITRICKTLQISPFKFFVAVYNLMIAKVHNMQEVTTGVPYQKRDNVRYQNTIGCFVNILPLRLSYNPGLTVANFLKNVSDKLDANIANNCPYERIAQLNRNLNETSSNDIFTIMLVQDFVENLPDGVKLLETPSIIPKYDQTWYWQKMKDVFAIKIEYNAAKFRPETIEWYIDRLLGLSNVVLKSLEAKVQDITPFPRITLANHVSGLINCRADHPTKTTPLHAVQHQFRNSPQAKLFNSSDSMSYQTIQKLSSVISGRVEQFYVKTYGTTPQSDTAVGVYCRQSLKRIPLMFAVWKTKLFPFNLNIDWPIMKQKESMRHFPQHIIITENPDDWLGSRNVISLNEIFNERLRMDRVLHLCSAPMDVMYVTCTSGTTGAPKCVVTEYSGHNNLHMAYSRSFFIGHHSVTYQVTNYAFDIFFADIMMSMSNGCCICVADGSIPDMQQVVESGVSHSYLMPAYMSTMSRADIEKIAKMECIFFGGEQMQRSVKDQLLANRVVIHEKYGTTEQTVYSTKYRVKHDSRNRLVGIPFTNLYMAGSTQDGHLSDGKMVSEVIQCGTGISRGYHNLKERTDSRYLPSIFGSKEDRTCGLPNVMYRTGDMLAFDGFSWRFHGRTDNQTKIQGKIVRISEVQEEISSFPDVKTCCVVEEKDSYGSSLLAYVQFKEGSTANIDQVRLFLEARCAQHCIPSYFMQISEFPLNANGKIDKRKLPKPEPKKQEKECTGRQPVTDVEKQICALFSEILKQTDVSVNADFFKLGGDSMRAMFAVQKINDIYEIDYGLRRFFDGSTAETIARNLQEFQSDDKNARPTLNMANKKSNHYSREELLEGIPLTPQQQQIWMVEKLNPGTDEYVIAMKIKLHGKIDMVAFQYSINKLVAQHPVLRMKISAEVPTQELRSLTEFYIRTQSAEITMPSLSASVSLCLHIKGNHILVNLSFHHIVVDGLSLQIIESCLLENYSNYVSRNSAKSVKVMKIARNPTASEKERTFWKNYLAEFEETKIRYTGTTPQKQSYGCNVGKLQTIVRIVDMLKTMASKNKCSKFHILTAALFSTLQQLGMQTDVTIGTIVGNRSMETENTVGMFTNSVALRCRIDSFSPEFLKHCVQQIDSALDHQKTPLSFVADLVMDTRDPNRHPIFNHVINLRSKGKVHLTIDELKMIVETDETNSAQFEHSWVFEETDGALELKFLYDMTVVNSSMAKTCVDLFMSNLKKLCSKPARSYPSVAQRHDIPMLSLNKVLDLQHSRTPENVFIKFNENCDCFMQSSMELARMAKFMEKQSWCRNGMAFRPDDLVAICLPESMDVYRTIFSCIRAGVAFLCIHPDTPDDRVSNILRASRPKLFITKDAKLSCLFPSQMTNGRQVGRIAHRHVTVQSFHRATCVDMMYSIFTSGSTGIPKCVCVSGDGASNMVTDWTIANNFACGGSVFMFSTCSFDGGLGNIFGSVVNGGTICVKDENLNLEKHFEQYKWIDVIHCTPAQLSQLMKITKPAVSNVNIGGDVFPVGLLENQRDFNIIQLYGPAEATCYTARLRMKQNSICQVIGAPSVNNQMWINGLRTTPQQDNVCGEIVISGTQVARGYLAVKPTGEAFMVNKNRTKEDSALGANSLVYCTGDLGWKDAHGFFHFVGRKDWQAKVNGVRFDPVEMEKKCSELKFIKEAVVKIVKLDGLSEIYLFYTGEEQHPDEIMSYLSHNFPYYLLPRRAIYYETFPHNINGKIDRAKLLVPAVDESIVEPIASKHGELILECWQESLQNPKLKVDDNFFACGGNSLLAVQLSRKISDSIKLDVTVRDIFMHPTPGSFIKFIEKESNLPKSDPEKASESVAFPGLDKVHSCKMKVPFHLRELARTMMKTRINLLKKSYNCHIPLREEKNQDHILKMINFLTMKHIALRSYFVEKEETVYQMILSGTESVILSTEANLMFDYNVGPLIGLQVDNLNPTIVYSHLAADGWSSKIIRNDFNELSNIGKLCRNNSSLDVLNFYKYLNMQQVLTYDFNDFKLNSLGKVHKFGKHLISDTMRKTVGRSCLREMAVSSSTSEFLIAMAVCAKNLFKYAASNKNNITIGFPIDMRLGKHENVVAFAVNTGVVSINPAEPNWFCRLLNDVTAILQNPFYSLSDTERKIAVSRLFDVMVSFEEYTSKDIEMTEQRSDTLSKFPFSLFFWEDAKNVTIEVHYWTSAFNKENVQDILEGILDDISNTVSVRNPLDTPVHTDNIVEVKNILYNIQHIESAISEVIPDAIIRRTSCDRYQLFVPPGTELRNVIQDLEEILPFELLPTSVEFQTKVEELKNKYDTQDGFDKGLQNGFPLSYQQAQMFYLSHNDLDNYYLNDFVNRFEKPLPVGTQKYLHTALMYVMQNHQMLRSRYHEINGEARQSIVSMTSCYFSPVTEEIHADDNINEVVSAKNRKKFNLLHDGPVRICSVESTDMWVTSIQIHHIIVDAKSTNIWTSDVQVIFNQLINYQIPFTKKRTFTYIHYVLRQKEEETHETAFQFDPEYKEKLQQALAKENIVSTRRPDLLVTHEWSIQTVAEASAYYKVTPFILFLVAYGRTLSRLLPTARLIVGIPLANRTPDTTDILGYFLNYVLFPVVQNGAEQTVEDISRDFARFVKFGYPLARVQQSLSSSERDGHIFTTFLNCRYRLESIDHQNLPSMIREIEVNQQNTVTPIDCMIDCHGENYHITVQTSTSQVTAEEVSLELNREIGRLLDMTNSPRICASDSSSCNTATHGLQSEGAKIFKPTSPQILHGHRCDIAPVPANVLVSKQAYRTPMSNCLLGRNFRLNYRDVESEIVRRSYCIKRSYWSATGLSLRADMPITVIGRKSLNSTLNCFSVLHGGGCYVPMDVSHPKERILSKLRNCGVSAYISEEVVDLTPQVRLDIDHPYKILKLRNLVKKCFNSTSPIDVAYIIHTSGSTGLPKGSVNAHTSVVNVCASSARIFQLDSTDVIYQFTNFVYDNSVLEYMMAFANGGSLFCCYERFVPKRFCTDIINCGITIALLFPGLLSLMDKDDWKVLKRLRYWVTGAEKLSANTFDLALHNDVSVIQNYGPTETTCFALTKKLQLLDHPNNLGYPIDNVSTTTIVRKCDEDATTRLELLVTGAGLMRGYTGKRVDESFIKISGHQFYCSGDVVKSQRNGEVIYLGRTDQQVKLLGVRIELGEIESVVNMHNDITHCKAFLLHDILHCCYHGTSKDISSDLKRQCQRLLPSHMIPQFVYIDQWPLTPNCKVDLPELKRMVEVLSESCEIALSEDKTTNQVIKLVEGILGVQGIREDHDIFYVGGNSLNIATICEALNEEFKCSIEPEQIYEKPTFADIAELVRRPSGESEAEHADRMMHDKNVRNNDRALSADSRVKTRSAMVPDKVDKSGSTSSESKTVEEDLTKYNAELAEIWIDLGLKVDNAADDPCFFTCGGTSYQLIVLRSRINKKFSVMCNIAELMAKTKLSEMASYIRTCAKHQSVSGSCVSVIRKDPIVEKTIVFLHPLVGGGFAPYRSLINRMRSMSNLEIIIVEHPNTFTETSDDFNITDTIPKLAKYYANHLEEHLQGTVVLIGASLGGRLAHEVGCVLRKTTIVINIDGAGPFTPEMITFKEHKQQMEAIIQNYLYEETGVDDGTVGNMVRNSWELLQMGFDYTPTTTAREKKMHLLSISGESLGWEKHVVVVVHKIDGEHDTMLTEDHCDGVYQLIEDILKKSADP